MRLALVAAIGVFATAPRASAEPAPRWGGAAQPRAGYLQLGIAPGVTVGTTDVAPDRCPGCDAGAAGGAMRIALGYMARDDLAPVIDVAFGVRGLDDPAGGFDTQAETTATVGLRYWLGARPWVEASAGFRAFGYQGPTPAVATRGWGGATAALAAGYELAAWPTFAVVVVADASATFGDDRRAVTGSLSLGVDWWYVRVAR